MSSKQRPMRIPDETFYPAVAKAKAMGTDWPIGRVATVLLDRWLAGEISLEESLPSPRSFELAEIALESAANSVQSGATLQNRGLDPLAREYLVAADEIGRLAPRDTPR